MHDSPPNFWLAQGLSEHRDYLYRMGRSTTRDCPCGEDIESATHVFQVCRRHAGDRPEVLDGLDRETREYLSRIVIKL